MAPSESTDAVRGACDALRQGRLILVTDHKRPERGAVVAVCAEQASDDVVNFMVTHARGLVAVALAPSRIERLGLALQAEGPTDLGRESYTVSIEAKHGVSTGISALDRARTLQAVADVDTGPDDLVTPGHVFPAQADPGGVLIRPGWAEAGLDLARIAGLRPAIGFCHVLDEQGELADAEIQGALAQRHGLPVVDISQLATHRLKTETFARQLTQATLPTAYGGFLCRAFLNRLDGKEHLALTLGDVRSSQPVLTRLHSECLTGDVFGSLRCDCGTQLSASLERIQNEGRGVLLYLQQEGRGIGIVSKVEAYRLQDEGRDTVEANLELGFGPDVRDFGVGAQMLMALGVQRIRLMTNNPRKLTEMEAFGIEVTERVPLEFDPVPENAEYLRAKKEKLGHLLDKV